MSGCYPEPNPWRVQTGGSCGLIYFFKRIIWQLGGEWTEFLLSGAKSTVWRLIVVQTEK